MDGDKKTESSGQDQQAGWVFKPGGGSQPAASAPKAPEGQADPQQAYVEDEHSIEWTGSEFIAHQKGASWYLAFFFAALLAAAFVYLITREFVSTGVILVVAVLFGIAANHKPRVLAYRLDSSGLTIGQKFYPYANFKSFALVDEGAFESISFIPLKRFLPTVNIYFPPDDADKILDVLAANLPMEQRKQGLVDSAARRIRF